MGHQVFMTSLGDSANRARKEVHDDFRAIGSLVSKAGLHFATSWHEMNRKDLPYCPCDRMLMMGREVAQRLSNRGSFDQQQKFRAFAAVFCETLYEAMTEPLPPMSEHREATVLRLFGNVQKEHFEATCAVAEAVQAQSPTAFDKAEREVIESQVATKSLAERLAIASREVRQFIGKGRPTMELR